MAKKIVEFEEENIVDSINVMSDGTIQVLTAKVLSSNGVEVLKQHHRHVLKPKANLDKEDERVKRIAEAAWLNLDIV